MDQHIITLGGNDKLDKIVADKIIELAQAKVRLPLAELQGRITNMTPRPMRNFYNALASARGVALIAEIKKASPSLGDININVDIEAQARVYEAGGANALSILTDAHFKGEPAYLEQVKKITTVPILRKDFIFDPYQIYESKYYGADALLLISSIVTLERLRELIALTHELGMECLLEVHSPEDMEKALQTDAKIIGINARDLRTFIVDLNNIVSLAKTVPKGRLLVAESGIENKNDVERVVAAGARAILVGTTLMQAKDLPAKIKELRLQ